MATRGLTFVNSRAPRAAGLSKGALDEHKSLIEDLYLNQNHTRDQVIEHLKTNVGLSMSPHSRDQFSKATRRWGLRKQRRAGSSIQSSLNDVATQCDTSGAARDKSLIRTNVDDNGEQDSTNTNESSKRPRRAASSSSCRSDSTSHGSSSIFVCRLSKRMKARHETDNTPASSLPQTEFEFADDTDLVSISSAEEEITCQDRYDDELSADYLACCYCYNKAFSYYRKIWVSLQHETSSPIQRRDSILDMARTAKTRRTSEIVREILESELETSSDPLSEDELNQSSSGKAEMCPMQSFLFHRHLAEIYEHRSDGAILVQKHLKTARSFTKALGTLGPPSTLTFSEDQIQFIEAKQHNFSSSIDLWTLLHLLPEHKTAVIPENLLNSLEWGETSLALDVRDCLDRCCEALTSTESTPIAIQYDAGLKEKIDPTYMSLLALQQDTLGIWTKTSLLFTFLWAKIQDKSCIRKYGTISATHFLMVMSRMIVRRSLLLSRHDKPPLDSENGLLELRALDRRVYRNVVEVLLHENRYMPNQIKREFVTEFVEHYSWSPPEGRKSVLVQQIQTHQIEALESVLAARSGGHPITTISTTLKEVTARKAKFSKMRLTSANSEFLDCLVMPWDQLDFTSERDAIACVRGSRYTPSFDSSSVSSYLRAPASHLNALNGNPTMSRSLASQSSRCSQVSVSNSFKHFKASTLKRLNSSESRMGLSLHDPGRQLQDDSLWQLQGLQAPRYFKVTMGLSTLGEDDWRISEAKVCTNQKGKLGEAE